MKMHAALAAALMFALQTLPAIAVMPDEMLKDPALEQRARGLSTGFRCLVCQNQSIDDSDAPLARDLRLLIRERITQGDSDAEVKNFVVSRYGDYVLLKPRFSVLTLALWIVPFAAVALGFAFVLRRRPASVVAEEAPLSPEEQQRLEKL